MKKDIELEIQKNSKDKSAIEYNADILRAELAMNKYLTYETVTNFMFLYNTISEDHKDVYDKIINCMLLRIIKDLKNTPQADLESIVKEDIKQYFKNEEDIQLSMGIIRDIYRDRKELLNQNINILDHIFNMIPKEKGLKCCLDIISTVINALDALPNGYKLPVNYTRIKIDKE